MTFSPPPSNDDRHDAPGRDDARSKRNEELALAVARDSIVLRPAANAVGLSDDDIDGLLERRFLASDGNGTYRLVGAERTGIVAARSALGVTGGYAICLSSAMAWEGVHLRWLPDDPAHVHVLIDAAAGHGSREWLTVHPTRRIDIEHETTYRDELRATTVPRSIRDFAAVLPRTPKAERQLDAWVDEARTVRRLEVWQIEQAADAERSRKVRKRLMDLHARHVGTDPATFKSVGEEWLRDLIRRRGLPEPLWNVTPPGSSKEVDAYYPHVPLIIEFDGYWTHRTRGKHYRDRTGDRRMLVGGGTLTVRVTQWHFKHDRAQLEDDIERLVLGRGLLLPRAA